MTDSGTISVDDPSVAQLAGAPYVVRVMCADAPLRISLRCRVPYKLDHDALLPAPVESCP